MVTGSCLCGGVRFEADEVALMAHCHCSMCRKALGAAFGTFAFVDPEKFRYVQGADLVTLYESSPGNHRGFCRVCGASLPGPWQDVPGVGIPAGTLDGDPGIRPALHVFVASKAPWWEIADELPKFARWVPGHEPKGRA